MNPRFRPYVIALGVSLLFLIVAVGPFFPSESIVYPTDVKDAPPVRRFRKTAGTENVEHFLPRETTTVETSPSLASPIGMPQTLSPENLSIENDAIAKARVFLDSHDNSEASQKQLIDRGFQQYLGRSPSESEAQAGLQALRDYLGR